MIFWCLSLIRIKLGAHTKNVFSYIKSMRNEISDITAHKRDGMLTMNTKETAKNKQFQKAFTTESSANPIPVKTPSSYAEMNKIKISGKDLNKLLNNINPKKATGPDELCGKILKKMKDHHTHLSKIYQHLQNTYMQKWRRTCTMP